MTDSLKDTGDVEITPEMVEAGVKVFASFDDRFDGEDETVELIFREMFRAYGSSVSRSDRCDMES